MKSRSLKKIREEKNAMDDVMFVQCNLEIMTVRFDKILLLKGSFPFLIEVGKFPEESFKLIKDTLLQKGIKGSLIVKFQLQTSKPLSGSIKTQIDDFTDKEFAFLREDIEHAILVLF
ncbi:MAG: hypothetical protein PHE21_03935 [Candidatus Dojkabacteria bacterium]|nr:hypothetical protein [Candidatus Dojkabacteria bacterium]